MQIERQQWDYRARSYSRGDLEGTLTDLGDDGWEVISVQPVERMKDGRIALSSNTYKVADNDFLIIAKRPRRVARASAP